MKSNKLKITMIIAIIILITMISFVGIYTQVQNRMENQVKDYSYAMDIKGERVITLKASTSNKTTIKDSEGKEVEDSSNLTDDEIAQKGYTKEETPYNNENVLNAENYEATKKIIEERLKDLEIDNYIIRINEETGDITIEVAEDDNADTITSNIPTVGKFEIIDSDTQEVLMDNNDIKLVNVMYGSNSSSATATSGTNVYLNIEFTKEGANKLENISGTYVNTTSDNTTSNSTTDNTTTNTENTTAEDTSGTTAKKIIMKIDDEKVMETSFDEVIRTGKLQLTIGSASTDTTKIKENAKKASNIAMVLDNGAMPIKYEVSQTDNKYVLSDITEDTIIKVEIAIAIIAAVALIILMIKYKSNGILAAICYIGLVSIFLLTIRYANVLLSLEGIFAIVVILILNYIFVDKLLNNIKNQKEKTLEDTKKEIKETYKNFFIRIIPIIIMSITFCFINWVPISSFGMVMFWGIVLIAIYNFIITATVIKLKQPNGEVKKVENKETKKKADKK